MDPAMSIPSDNIKRTFGFSGVLTCFFLPLLPSQIIPAMGSPSAVHLVKGRIPEGLSLCLFSIGVTCFEGFSCP